MAFNIKDERVIEAARSIAAQTGESLSEAIARSIDERAARLASEPDERRARVMRLVDQCRDIIGDRPLPDHGELLYDPNTGLPR